MGWRVVVVTNPSKLDYSMGYLAVRDVEKQRASTSTRFPF